jgi:D-lactate dehydrogenase (cytochrome)
MVACNASGARSFRFSATRNHVSSLKMALADGRMIALRRGSVFAAGRTLTIPVNGGAPLTAALPTYQMPRTKNASGYFVQDDMDAIDLLIGSDGTLGVFTEIEVGLLPALPAVWGVS